MTVADKSERGVVPHVGDFSLPTLGYVLVLSWLLVTGLFFLSLLAGYPGIYRPERYVVVRRFVEVATVVPVFLNGIVGVVVLTRTFGYPERTQGVLAIVTLFVGVGSFALARALPPAGFAFETVAMGLQIRHVYAIAIVAVPISLVAVGFLLRQAFASEPTERSWFLLALLSPFYMVAHVSTVSATSDSFYSVVLGGIAPVDIAFTAGYGVILLTGVATIAGVPWKGSEDAGVDPDLTDGVESESTEPTGSEERGSSTPSETSIGADRTTATATNRGESQTAEEQTAGPVGDETPDDRHEQRGTNPSPSVRPALERAVTDLRNLQTVESDGVIETYTGSHEDADGTVRVRALSPDIEDESAAGAFTNAVAGWVNGESQPNVVGVVDRGRDPRPWIALAPEDGAVPLAACADELGTGDIVEVAVDAAEALRLVSLYSANHYDLSPDCVWIDREGTRPTAMVGEWGLERAVRDALGRDHVTPYTAPEQVRDRGVPDERTDVYGLGAVTYHALTGEPPVQADPVEIRNADIPAPSTISAVPKSLDRPVLRALDRDPENRFDSPRAFAMSMRSEL